MNGRTPDGSTALMIAVLRGDISTVKILRDRHPQILIRNNEGKTALDIARQKGYNGLEPLLGYDGDKVEGVFTADDCVLCHSICVA